MLILCQNYVFIIVIPSRLRVPCLNIKNSSSEFDIRQKYCPIVFGVSKISETSVKAIKFLWKTKGVSVTGILTFVCQTSDL